MSNYFDNDATQKIIEEYQSYFYKNNNSVFVLKEDTEENRLKVKILKNKIFEEVSKIINGIIFTHHFTIWESYDDLFQEAAEACIKALPKFNPKFITSNGKFATAFNYFSLTAKRCLKFYTIRNKKNRDTVPIEDYNNINLEYEDYSTSIIYNDFIKQLKVLFSTSKNKKFLDLVDILEEYLRKIGEFNKRDFFRFSKSYGWSPNLIRKFLKIIKENEENIRKN